jgi:hypothetical protein
MRSILRRWMARRQGDEVMSISVGQVLSRTSGMLKKRFAPLLALWAVFFAMQIGLFVAFAFLIGTSTSLSMMSGDLRVLGGGMMLGMVVFYIVYFLLYLGQIAGLIAMASPLQHLSFGESFEVGIRSAPTMLGVLVLLLIGYFIAALGFTLVGGVLSLLSSAMGVVLTVLLLPAAIYLSCRLAMVNPVVAVERIGNPLTAIARGWSISKGNVLGIFLSFLLLAVAAIVIGGISFAPMFGQENIAAMEGTPPSLGLFGLTFAGLTVLGILLSIVGSTLFAVLHSEIVGYSERSMDEVFG